MYALDQCSGLRETFFDDVPGRLRVDVEETLTEAITYTAGGSVIDLPPAGLGELGSSRANTPIGSCDNSYHSVRVV